MASVLGSGLIKATRTVSTYLRMLLCVVLGLLASRTMQSVFGKQLARAITLHRVYSLLPSIQEFERFRCSFEKTQRIVDSLVSHRINTLLAVGCGGVVCFFMMRFLSAMFDRSLQGRDVLFDFLIVFPLFAFISIRMGIFSFGETTYSLKHRQHSRRVQIPYPSSSTNHATTNHMRSSSLKQPNSFTPRAEPSCKTKEPKESLQRMLQEQMEMLRCILTDQNTTQSELRSIRETLETKKVRIGSQEKGFTPHFRPHQSDVPVYTSTPDMLSGTSTRGDMPCSRLFRNLYIPRFSRSESYPTLKSTSSRHGNHSAAFGRIWPIDSESKCELLFLRDITGLRGLRPLSLTSQSPHALSDSGLSLNMWRSQLVSNDTNASTPVSSITFSKFLTTSFWREMASSPRTVSRDMLCEIKARGNFFFDSLDRLKKSVRKLKHQPWLWFKRNVFDNYSNFKRNVHDLVETAMLIENKTMRFITVCAKFWIGVCRIIFWPQLKILSVGFNILAPLLLKDMLVENNREQHIIRIGTPFSSTSDVLGFSFPENTEIHH